MNHQRSIFVVRLWDEPDLDGSGDRSALRGSVEIVGSEERSYFDDLDQLGELLTELWQQRSGHARGSVVCD